jgi:ribosomal protein L44E
MSIATQCKFFGHVITIEKALAVKKAAPAKQRHTLVFECVKCGKAVRPYAAGDRCGAHFVHLSRNPQCQFIDPPRDY